MALQRAEAFPDELTRWPVQMLIQFEPRDLKAQFHALALQLMERVASSGNDQT